MCHVDKNARWRWQYVPLSIKSGVTLDARLDHQKVTSDDSFENSRIQTFRLLPHFCIKLRTPVFGSLGEDHVCAYVWRAFDRSVGAVHTLCMFRSLVAYKACIKFTDLCCTCVGHCSILVGFLHSQIVSCTLWALSGKGKEVMV